MPNTLALKYLFEAHLKNGSILKQTQEDVSVIDHTRSAFYDVVRVLDDVRVFGLYSEDHTYTVSLTDGHFEIDGVPFSAQPVSRPLINEGGKFKLLYFRDHQQEFVVTASVGADGQIIEASSPGPHYHQYRMGWEYNDPNGQTYTQTIVIV